jgi:hypothetical protein
MGHSTSRPRPKCYSDHPSALLRRLGPPSGEGEDEFLADEQEKRQALRRHIQHRLNTCYGWNFQRLPNKLVLACEDIVERFWLEPV